MKSAGKARNNGLYRHIRTSKEIIRNLLNDSFDNNIKNLPITTQANLIIFKSGSASDIVERSIWTGETYFGKYGGANKVESWVLIK